MNRAWLAAGAVTLCAAVASCATVPTSGGIPVGTLQESGFQGATGVQVVPVRPGRNWTPREIVQGFLAASASFANNHAVARDYLTQAFARAWHPHWSATVVDGQHLNPNTVPHNVVTGGAPRAAVIMTGKHFATLQTAGRDQAGSVVVAPAATAFRFSLVQQDGQWRIDSIDRGVVGQPSRPAPKSLLLLTRADFNRDYLPRSIYFFPAGSPANMLVPDPVYIPQTGLLSEVRGLVSALMQPRCHAPPKQPSGGCPANPSEKSWLFGAAVTAFPRGVRTVRPVQVVGGVTAIVDLGNTAAKTSATQRRRMAAQLAWSLIDSPYGSQAGGQIRSVELKFGRRTIQASLAPKWVPRPDGKSWYYQVPSVETAQPVHVVQQTSGSQPTPLTLPAKLGVQSFTAMAVSPDQLGTAVLAGCNGKNLYLMPRMKVQDVVTRRLPGACRSLSWDAEGNLWIASSAGVFELRGASAQATAKLVSVQIPLPVLKAIRTLSVAPDGVRVAMIVPSGPVSKIMIAAISKTSTFTYIAQTAALRVGSDLSHPVALSWLDPDHLLVLDRSGSGRPEIYQVPLNGGASTVVNTPPGVTSLSAAWHDPGKRPVVVVGTGGTPGKIEVSRGPLVNLEWKSAGNGATPVFPG